VFCFEGEKKENDFCSDFCSVFDKIEGKWKKMGVNVFFQGKTA
jgi:hypothetical protein